MGQASEVIGLPSKRPEQMVAAYRANMFRGRVEVREMALEDIRRISELGAWTYVDDLTEALFMFDDEAFFATCPESALLSSDLVGN
ncbi:MAG: hypothetical protein ACR652_24100 [Methylocystis sp.]|uniref:hypothetical protein n=1 Tax=Methylocystis sp. TaxID=1911079 RepID=UPI003DA2B299